MKNYALIENGIVTNTTIADNNWDSTGWVEHQNAGIGWNYDGIGFYSPQCHSEAVLNDYRWICDNAEHNPKV